jgi:hypothetical protein
LGFTTEEEKKMKKRISDLSSAEREKVEADYHQMQPEDFAELLTQAEWHKPATLRLPATLLETLQALSELAGEPDYQTMVLRWIEERLQQEAQLALRVSKQPKSKAWATLARRMAKKTLARA